MDDALSAFRSMLRRPVTVDDALVPYLGLTPIEADQQAEAAETADGLRMDRLRDLVTIVALREAPPAIATLVAALLWRSVPVASDVGQVRDAATCLALWRGGLSPGDVARIVAAHREYGMRFAEVMGRTGRVDGPEIDALLSTLAEAGRGDLMVTGIGECLLMVGMTDTGYFVCLEDPDGTMVVIDRVPHHGGGGPDDAPGEIPDAPRPHLRVDA